MAPYMVSRPPLAAQTAGRHSIMRWYIVVLVIILVIIATVIVSQVEGGGDDDGHAAANNNNHHRSDRPVSSRYSCNLLTICGCLALSLSLNRRLS